MGWHLFGSPKLNQTNSVSKQVTVIEFWDTESELFMKPRIESLTTKLTTKSGEENFYIRFVEAYFMISIVLK